MADSPAPKPPKADFSMSPHQVRIQMLRDSITDPAQYQQALEDGAHFGISDEAVQAKTKLLQQQADEAAAADWYANTPDGRRAKAAETAAQVAQLDADAKLAKIALSENPVYRDVNLDALTSAELIHEAFGSTEEPDTISAHVPHESEAAATLARNWTRWTAQQRQEHAEYHKMTDAEIAQVAARRATHSFS